MPEFQCRSIPGPNGGTLRPFAPGVSGNPRGRPVGGLTIIEHYNAITDAMERGAMNVDDLDAIIESDPNGNRRIAAASYKRAMNTGYFNATPLAANDLDRILDRTVGKPTQRVEVAQVERDPATVLADLAAMVRSCPELANDLAALLPVDSEAGDLAKMLPLT